MMPKSTATMSPAGVDEEIALMHVGVEEAVAQRVAQEGLHQPPRQQRQIVARGAQRRDVGKLDAVDPFERQHVARRESHSTFGTRKPGSPAVASAISESAAASRRRSISIATERAERVDDGDRPQPPRGRIDPLDQSRAGVECLEVAAEAAANARPQHLDRDRARARPRRRFRPCAPGRSRRRRPAARRRRTASSTGRPSAFSTEARASLSGNGSISSRRRPSASPRPRGRRYRAASPGTGRA